MKFYDITRELFSSKVYPGDPVPEFERILEVKKGDACNLTYLKMCAHNGTHMDAPRHFLDEGKSIEELPLEQVMGSCAVLEYNGELDGETAAKIIEGKGKKQCYYQENQQCKHCYHDRIQEIISHLRLRKSIDKVLEIESFRQRPRITIKL